MAAYELQNIEINHIEHTLVCSIDIELRFISPKPKLILELEVVPIAQSCYSLLFVVNLWLSSLHYHYITWQRENNGTSMMRASPQP